MGEVKSKNKVILSMTLIILIVSTFAILNYNIKGNTTGNTDTYNVLHDPLVDIVKTDDYNYTVNVEIDKDLTEYDAEIAITPMILFEDVNNENMVNASELDGEISIKSNKLGLVEGLSGETLETISLSDLNTSEPLKFQNKLQGVDESFDFNITISLDPDSEANSVLRNKVIKLNPLITATQLAPNEVTITQ